MCMQKPVSNLKKKNLIKRLQMGQIWVSHYKTDLIRQSMKWKHSDSPIKKKFLKGKGFNPSGQ